MERPQNEVNLDLNRMRKVLKSLGLRAGDGKKFDRRSRPQEVSPSSAMVAYQPSPFDLPQTSEGV